MSNVYSQQNNGFGPLFDVRKSRERYIMLTVLIIICFMVSPSYFNINLLLQHRTFLEDLVLVSMTISSLIIGEFLRRITFFFEEIFHVETRYKGSFRLAFYQCVAMTTNFRAVCFIFITTILVTINHWKYSDKEILSFTMYVTNIVCSSFVMHLLKLKQLSLVEYSHLNETEEKHLAAGFAWGYYFGYLKEQLPNLRSLVEEAIAPYSIIKQDDARNYLNPVMYIIIPKDCCCTGSFEKCDVKIKFEINLEDKRNTGGLHERSYKSSVYSIKLKGRKPKYIIMEYAKPVRNLFLMSLHTKNGLNKEDLDHEVVLFYKKLKNILEDDLQCSGYYKLILLSSTTAQKNNLANILYKSVMDDEMLVD